MLLYFVMSFLTLRIAHNSFSTTADRDAFVSSRKAWDHRQQARNDWEGKMRRQREVRAHKGVRLEE